VVNWIGDLDGTIPPAEKKDVDYIENPGGCGQCHVGIGIQPYTMRAMDAPDVDEAYNVDCLMCHAPNYTRHYYHAQVGGAPTSEIYSVPKIDGVFDYSVQLKDAREVGPTTADACQRCHVKAGGGATNINGVLYSHKRGSAFSPANDVHARAGMTCSTCHYDSRHKFRRARNNDNWAYDKTPPEEVVSTCLSCHDAAPHSVETYNTHFELMACEACHATGIGGVVEKDFSVITGPNPDNFYNYGVACVKNPADWRPTFLYFNGKVNVPCEPRGSKGDGKVYPFKAATFTVAKTTADDYYIPMKLGKIFLAGDQSAARQFGISSYNSWFDLYLDTSIFQQLIPEFDTVTYDYVTDPSPDWYWATVTGDVFSLSHGITKESARTCTTCHSVSDGEIDWTKLGISNPCPYP
jgi:hypothetical protein